MSGREAEGTRGPSPSEVGRIAEACARFEAAWARGERPRIEESLGDLGPDFDPMLSRLLPLELSLRLAAGESPSPGEYLSRFPGSRGLVEAAFADHTTVADATAAAPPRPQPGPGSASNLLTGILALQNGFIDHVALIAAIRAWAADRTRGVAEILAADGKLDARQVTLLEALAEEHRKRHGDELAKNLSAFGSLAPVMRAVAGMGDPEVEAGLTIEPESTVVDEEATTAHQDAPGGSAGPGASGGWSASRFEVLSFHNAGMLGKVFIALDRELNRNVALKEIQERHAHHRVNRDQFVLEGMVTGALEHPGIVPVYSMGSREDGSPFYAMRFIQGPSLREKLKQLHGTADAPPLGPDEERPTLPRLLRHFIHACHAMAYAHSRGVIHRDLKPEHVLLGPFGETLVVDWGLAMPVAGGADGPYAPLEFPTGRDAALAQDGVVVGTLPYMSPEQAEGKQSRLDRRSDVYALGAILYALLTGRAPVVGGSFAAMLVQVRRGDFPRPRDVARQAPPALEAICLKAMSHAPDGRYASATDLARDVERWLDDEPTVAYPEPVAVRAGRWLRRHRTAAAAAAVALICTTLGLVLLNIQTNRANVEIRKQRDRAEEARAEAVVARREAEDVLSRSVEVFRRVLLPVAEVDLPRAAGAARLRRRVAAGATEYLERIRERRPDDPEIRYQAAQGYRELAKITMLLGESTDVSHLRAVELLRGTVTDRPDELRYQDALAETLMQFGGGLLIEGKSRESESPLREALGLAIALRARRPEDPAYRRTEARVSNDLANQRLAAGDHEEAARLAQAAWLAMAPLADSDSPGPTDRIEVVNFLDTLGDAQHGGGLAPAAVAAFAEGLRRAEALIAAGSEGNSVPYLKASLHLKQARSLATIEGRDADAATAADSAVAGFERLVEVAGPIVQYSELLAESLLERGRAGLVAGKLPEARADLDRGTGIVVELAKGEPDRPAYAGLTGRLLGHQGLLDLKSGEPESARSKLTRALERLAVAAVASPDDPVIRKAREQFERALNEPLAPE